MRTIAFALAVVLLFGIVRAQNEGQVVWIGRINEDYSYNWLNAVSANGDTAVGISTDNVDRRTAFVWNRTTGITALQNGFQGYATDITPDGTIIVGSAPST